MSTASHHARCGPDVSPVELDSKLNIYVIGHKDMVETMIPNMQYTNHWLIPCQKNWWPNIKLIND
ncbi:MAG: hypothetical protein SWH54_17575 [Thermodesulfobacteriota bacterium]|nr:hypothetical protein [Thermodesulfobacteriota bacterium]